MSELISVIVPAYNMENYLKECVDSILAQTYRNLEIILIDDGSTDRTGKMCDEYAKRDSRIVVVHQKNQGLPRSRKIGVSIAKGKYIGFVDSDDWIEPGMYECLYHNLQTSEAQVVTSGYIQNFSDGRFSYHPGYIPGGIYHPKEDPAFCRNMIYGEGRKLWGISPNFWSKLFERTLLCSFLAQVDDQIVCGEDDACVYPCMLFAETVCVTNSCLYHYRMREMSMSRAPDEQYFARINLLYSSMKQSFRNHPFADIIRKELDAYIVEFVMRGIDTLSGIHIEYKIPRFSFNLEALSTSETTVLYGAGNMGQSCYCQLKMLNLHKRVYWVDKDYIKFQEQGFPVFSPQTLLERAYSSIVVAVEEESLYAEIRIDLAKMGIETKKVIWAEPRRCF